MAKILCRLASAVFAAYIAAGGMGSACAADQPRAQLSDQAQKEAEFFKSRDTLRQRAASNPSGATDVPDELKRQLEAVIGPVKVGGFPESGRVSPHLISNDPCCQHIDSLEFENTKGEWLFVTTRGLIDNNRSGNAASAAKNGGKQQSEKLYYDAMAKDFEEISNFSDLPVHCASEACMVRAFLGKSSVPDTPGLSPDQILVFLLAGDRIYFMSSPTGMELPEIRECKRKWSALEKRSSVALDGYHASNKKDESLWFKYMRLDEEAFSTYLACYHEKSKQFPFFALMTKRAQSMVDRLKVE